VAASSGRLVVDMRAFDTSQRRALTFALVDKFLELGISDSLMVITEHESSGIGYQIDLRKETRGRFEFSCAQRSDGAWVAVITPKKRS
jgi:hypothetical protein